MAVEQKVLRKLEDNCNETKQFKHDRLVHVAMKPLNLSPVSLDDVRVRPFVLRDELEDIIHLHVITPARKDLNRPEWSVPVVAAGFEVGAVLELLSFREFEEFLTDGELTVDFLLGETEIGDVEESYRFHVLKTMADRMEINMGTHQSDAPRPSTALPIFPFHLGYQIGIGPG